MFITEKRNGDIKARKVADGGVIFAKRFSLKKGL